MNERLGAFIEEIRASPKFVEAASKDMKWIAHVNAIEIGLDHYSRAEDPREIELFDKLCAIISDESRTTKQRLLAIVDITSEFKYGRHGRN
jgi:hypothetical protein